MLALTIGASKYLIHTFRHLLKQCPGYIQESVDVILSI